MDNASNIIKPRWGAPEGWIGNPAWPGILKDGRKLVHGTLPIAPDEPAGKMPLAESLAIHSHALEAGLGGDTLASKKIVFVGAHQVHGDKIEVINPETNFPDSVPIPGINGGVSLIEFAETDSLIARRPNTILIIQTADCLPILFFDPATNLIGACHCGWRGLIAGLAGKTARRMIELGATEKTLEAWIGPGIRVENYEVGAELVGRFKNAFPSAPVSPNGTHLDLAAVARADLAMAGLQPENISDSEVCTYGNPANLHSYRRDGEKSGRLLTLFGVMSPR